MAIVKKYAKELYAKEVVMKAAYMFTDCAYLHLDVDTENYLISMQSKTNQSEETLLNRFENELIVQQARYMVTKDTKNIREMIVARALSSTIVNLVKEEEIPQNKYNAIDIILTIKFYVPGNIQWKSYTVLFLALFLRHIMSGYNYQEIPTKNVEKGMVLSYVTLAKFLPSRVKGLPKQGGEDMRYRITEDEMNAIKRWESSKYGEDTIIIVRKIPFAIFIIAGILLLFIIRILR